MKRSSIYGHRELDVNVCSFYKAFRGKTTVLCLSCIVIITTFKYREEKLKSALS